MAVTVMGTYRNLFISGSSRLGMFSLMAMLFRVIQDTATGLSEIKEMP